MQSKKVSNNKTKRLLACIWRQKSKTPVCPETPLLTNKIVVITGGNRGIGLETTKGLVKRGAEVIILSRNQKIAHEVIKELRSKVHFIKLDLADISSVNATIGQLEKILAGRKIDILINNAGIAMREPYQASPQGHELTFAVNVLGHHVLFKECHSKSLFNKSAQIIAITGDLYVQADDCTPDYTYKGNNGNAAYARSKLGVMWWAYELKRKHPNYKLNIVHPGAVLTELGGGAGPITKLILGGITLNPVEGAQVSLICATQADIVDGGYYHNTVGRVLLPKNDIAKDKNKAKEFWNTLESLCENK